MLDLLKLIFTNVWYVAMIALFFGGSIFVHELGHFLAARRRGLKVLRFSIGFGPKIFSWMRDGVEYRLSWIPLGGYVALPQLADMRGIEGEPGTEAEDLPPISYTDKMIVAVMGAVFNVLFAFMLACVLWAMREPTTMEQSTTKIGFVQSTVTLPQSDGTRTTVPSPAAEAGLRVGDVIKRIDGRSITKWRDVTHAIITGTGRMSDDRREAVFDVEREGQPLTLTLHPLRTGEQNSRQVGIAPDFDVFVHEVPAGTMAAQVGLRAGDLIVALAGVKIRNGQTYGDLLNDRPGEELPLTVRRDGQTIALIVPPRPAPVVLAVYENSIAQKLGVMPNDQIVRLDGQTVMGAKALVTALNAGSASIHTLSIQRGSKSLDVTIPGRKKGEKIGIEPGHLLGDILTAEVHWIRVNPVRQCLNVISETYYTFASLLSPGSDVGIKDMSGPLGIANVYYRAAQENIRFVIWLTILVNINLAIFNLMPIPVLDGGHMLLATITKIRGRSLPPNFLVTAQSVFMVLLLSLVLYVTVFDGRRLWSDFSGPEPVRNEPPPAAGPDAAPAKP